ncbi:type IV secretion system protein [Rickettsiaceae bacterium]|nr:type IV secretion system protein [Rickettsiaceae bacterium]
MKKLFDHVVLLLGVCVVLIFSAATAHANTFGQSCSALPMLDSSNYLYEKTAYGFIQQNLDMKTHVEDACLEAGDDFRFCIMNPAGDIEVCTQVSMTLGQTTPFSALSTNPNLGGHPSLGKIPLTVEFVESELCLTMPTSRGVMPIMCRNRDPQGVATPEVERICKTLGDSCYDGRKKSQSLLAFSGLTIHCLRDTLNKVFYVGNECPTLDNDTAVTVLRPFPRFQQAMKMGMSAVLIIYVMVYGFQLAMNHEYASLNQVASFLIKFILVAYFAVGLGPKTFEYGREVQHNGMTELALPLLVELTTNFTEAVFLAGGAQGLCNYDASKYENGYEFYKVWDAIDCRVGYYLGMQMLYNIGGFFNDMSGSVTEISHGSHAVPWGQSGGEGIDALDSVGAFSFFSVLFGYFMAGNIIILILGLVFVVSFISVILYFISAYLVCMVTLYAMAYISPIFIPMALFQRTKGYFDAWLKIVASCTLQPAVIGGFIALLLTMYDSAIYGTCEFQRHDYNFGEYNFSTFELRIPDVEARECIDSAGFKLVKHYLGHGWEKKIVILFEIPKIQDYMNLTVSMTYVILFVVLFYFFMKSVNQFASDLTSGPSMDAVTVSPNMVIDKVRGLASAAVSAAKSGAKAYAGDYQGAAEDAKEASDKISEDTSSNRGGASDKVSTGGGGGGASDKISVGGGGGGEGGGDKAGGGIADKISIPKGGGGS